MPRNTKELIPLKKIKQTKKSLEKQLDKLWREVSLIRANHKCEYWGCNKTDNLNAHHVFSRSRRSVRWDIENCFILCPYHHSLGNDSAHKDPEFLKKVLGEITGFRALRNQKWYQMLRLRAYTPNKADLKLEKLYLEGEINRYLQKNKAWYNNNITNL